MMKLKNVKDWKTTVLAVTSGAIMLAGVLWPEKIDPETGEEIKLAVAELATGIGMVIAVITGLLAKDE